MITMTDERNDPGPGEMKWVPEGAYVVYSVDDVVAMFGHSDAASTRSFMNKYGYPRMIRGWPVEEVEYVLQKRDPDMVEHWRRARMRREELRRRKK